ncbi:MAG: hypothetical protein R3A10_14800 [Caldilineaceae bacterium]
MVEDAGECRHRHLSNSYFILAFVLLMLFAYYILIFPLVGGGSGRLTSA